MIKELLYKWFGLDPIPCATCEVLREQLHRSEAERREILNRLLDKDKPEPPSVQPEEMQPIQPQFIPWRVRQQLLEAEDRKQAQLIKSRKREIDESHKTGIDELEKELEIPQTEVVK